MKNLRVSPLDPAFVQDPYPTYAQARTDGPILWWDAYEMPAVFDAATIHALLRDKRLGRAIPETDRSPAAPHLMDFDRLERASMLDMEPPEHTRLRSQVLRAFTSRQIAGLAPVIAALSAELISAFPKGPFDLIPAFCAPLPVRVIARLLGVPQSETNALLEWSNAMVAMYQAGRNRASEDRANTAAAAFAIFLKDQFRVKRAAPQDDLISHLLAVPDLSEEERLGTCVLLLNAGHEATVHSLGNAVRTFITHQTPSEALATAHCAQTVEEMLRYDPPLHLFTRYVLQDLEVHGTHLRAGSQIALVLGAAGRDPALCDTPDAFDPFRPSRPHAAFGGGIHFCLGAPLARMELQIALSHLFAAHPDLKLAEPPRYAPTYHFHKHDRLMVTT